MTVNNRRECVIRRLREVAADLSGVTLAELRPEATFLDLGFDSLFLTQLSAAYQKAFGVRITFRQLFDELPTMAALGAYIDSKLPAEQVVAAAEAEPVGPVATEAAATAPATLTQPPPPASIPVAAPVQPQPEIALPTANLPLLSCEEAGAVDGLETVILQQLELMAAQLRLLQGLPAEAAVSLPASPQTVAAAAAEVTGAAPPLAVPPPAAGAATVPNEVQVQKGPAAAQAPSGFGPGSVQSSGLHPLPPEQQRHLDTLIANYTRKTAGSKERTQRYRRPLADPRTAAGFNRRWKEMVYPIWVERSLGSKLWDVDGNEYIDLLNGFGPNFLGHRPSFVVQALEEQLRRGFEIGPQTPLAGEVAEMICRLTGMDRVSFTCSGSEAVQAAMRLARTVTGRDKVVVFSRDYHGNFDQVLVREANRAGKLRTLPSAPGIPIQSVDDTYVIDYGTEESLQLIRQHAQEIAAVLVEPVQSRRPEFQPREFLHELRRITRETGVILVFDEVVTGFRSAPGGAQACFGVEADLATYGKVVAGGMPIGIVAGRSSVMDTFDGGFWQYGDDSFPSAGVTFFAGTFVRHPLAIAAAHAVLKHLIQEGPALQQRVADKAARFAARVNDLFKRYEVNIELPRFTSQMYLRINEHAELANLLAYHLRYRGVHILEGFPCYMTDAHSDEDIQRLVAAFRESVEAMVADGIFGDRSKLLKAGVAEAPAAPARAAEPQPGAVVPISAASTEFPATDAQREMWIAAQIRPEASAANNGSNVVELIGELDVPALERAIAEVVRRHEALRCTFSDDGTRVLVDPARSLDLQIHDLSGLSVSESEARVRQTLEQDGRQVFDLAKGPIASFRLITLSRSKHLLVFTAQMIICDGWGFKVVLEEVSALYSAYVKGREAALPPVQPMREYALRLEQERASGAARECEEFWLSQFATLPPAFELPSPHTRPPARTFEAARESLRLPPPLYQEIKRVARELRSTPFALTLTAYAAWLYRLSGIDDFVIGVPFAGQGSLGLNQLVGQCVHTLPFRVQVERGASFADLLARMRTLILDAQERWDSNFGALVQKLSLPADPSRIPLVPTMFNLDPVLSEVRFSGCVSRIVSGPRFFFPYDQGFNVIDQGETLLVECDYNTNLFDEATIRHWLEGFQALLQGVAADPKQPLSRLPMLSEEEWQRRLAGSEARLEKDHSVLLGQPVTGTYIRILDDQLQPVPVGIPGELLIGGVDLARGYRDLPGLSAERFIPDPFSSEPGAQLFRTGDLARYRADGSIYPAGRRESHVHLRGYRIALGGIESALLVHPQVREAAVVLHEDAPDEARLIAYVACDEGAGDGLPAELLHWLRGRLPAYMVPAAIVVLPCMPRTPEGKVDRGALPPPPKKDAEVPGGEYVAPRTQTEERLARLWCEALRLERVSTCANFFDLGGQSLLAVALFAKIEKEFGKKLPLATLFTTPTIEGLAAVLSSGNGKLSWSTLVPIQPKGSKPPLFLVHGAGGNVLLYHSLGEHLAPDYPLYGLQSAGLDGESEPLRTIEEMAACYLREVRKVQPRGPYYLGGYCLGGTIAYEMAQVLRREGEEVPLVAMLDTYNYSRALRVSFRSFLYQKARFHLANLSHLRLSYMKAYLKEKGRLALGGELANLRTSMPGGSRQDGVGRATSGVEFHVQAINDYAAEHYDPLPYPGQLALFKPRFNYKFYPDPKMGWGDLALGGLDIIEVAVNPHSMLLEPFVQVLAAHLKERIGATLPKPADLPVELSARVGTEPRRSDSPQSIEVAMSKLGVVSSSPHSAERRLHRK